MSAIETVLPKSLRIPSSVVRTVASWNGFVHRPFPLRLETDARTVSSAAFVRAAECRGRCPRRRNELRNREIGFEDLRLECGDILVADQLVIEGRYRVLPDQRFFRHERAEVTLDRAHVAVRELEPRTRKCIGELIGILEEAPRDLFVCRIESQ